MIQFIKTYLNAIGITGYEVTLSKDGDLDIIVISIPKYNNERIGILKGKDGKNLMLLKKMVHIIGPLNGMKPFIIIKLI